MVEQDWLYCQQQNEVFLSCQRMVPWVYGIVGILATGTSWPDSTTDQILHIAHKHGTKLSQWCRLLRTHFAWQPVNNCHFFQDWLCLVFMLWDRGKGMEQGGCKRVWGMTLVKCALSSLDIWPCGGADRAYSMSTIYAICWHNPFFFYSSLKHKLVPKFLFYTVEVAVIQWKRLMACSCPTGHCLDTPGQQLLYVA